MQVVCTPEQMAAADERTIADGTPGEVLMARAAAGVARVVRGVLGGTYGRRVVVVAGKGNNGGDGLIAASLLERAGVRVDRFELAALDRTELDRALGRADLAIDAMFGTGFRGELDADAAYVADAFAEHGVPVVAVDIPSGVDGATGVVRGVAVRAHHTVCFAALKRGLVFEPGRSLAGALHVIDIGVDVGGTGVDLCDDADVSAWLPPRPPETNKWKCGVLVVGGSPGMTGAAIFVSTSAMRAGAGIAYCCLPGRAAVDAHTGSEVVLRALPATESGSFAIEAARAVGELATRFHAVAIGPGLGADGRAAEMARTLVAELPQPLVIDADGLNALAGDLAPLRVRAAAGLAPAILTPHDGEYARLTGHRPGADRVAAARELADATRAIVLLKGATTVVAAPSGRAILNGTGTPVLASAGTGDVLTGVIAAFVARGVAPFEAAAAAAHVHGRAAASCGAEGVVAGDVMAAIPRTLDGLRPEQEDA